MFRKKLRVIPSFLLAGVLAATGPALADKNERAFRIESKAEKPGARADLLEMTYTLVNSSSKRITAWDFGCVDILQDGTDGGTTRTSADGYRTLEMSLAGREGVRLGGDVVLEPNQRVEKTIVFDPAPKSGPFAATTCGPLVAIFEDATFEGDENSANVHFERRKQEAIQAKRTHRDLERRIEQGTPLAAAVESIAAQPGRPLQGISQAIRRGYPVTPEMVFSELEDDFQWAIKHLPAAWKAQVEKELP